MVTSTRRRDILSGWWKSGHQSGTPSQRSSIEVRWYQSGTNYA